MLCLLRLVFTLFGAEYMLAVSALVVTIFSLVCVLFDLAVGSKETNVALLDEAVDLAPPLISHDGCVAMRSLHR